MPKNTFQKAIIFIHVAFIHKIEVSLKNYIIKLAKYRWFYIFHIFLFSPVLEIIWRTIFFLKINIYFYFTASFCIERDNFVQRGKAYRKTNNLTYIMLKSVAKCGSYCHFLKILNIIKLTDIKPLPQNAIWMNWLIPEPWVIWLRKRTKWLVIICLRSIFCGVQNCISG